MKDEEAPNPARDAALSERGGYPKRLGELLPGALDRLGPKGLWTEARLRRLWAEAVGPEVAEHSSVRRLRGKTLEVDVSSDAWATELRYLTGVVCDKLNAELGPGRVTEVVVRRRRGGS